MSDLEYQKNNQLYKQRAQLEDAKQVGYACEDMAADIKINLAGQRERMQNNTLRNLQDIQNQAGVAGKLLSMIKRQRQKNKYVLWAVYALIGCLVIFILFQTFGWMIPSFGSSEETIKVTEPIGEPAGSGRL